MKFTVLAPAKLNLFLDITGRRNDGYHIVNMVMQSVSLYDEVSVSLKEDSDEIEIECSDYNIPCDESNTAYKAVKKFFEHTDAEPTGVLVRIKKRIPAQAGMAGGSTDAAAVLAALNELTETGLTKQELAEIGEEIGADVPFCLFGGTMTAGGIGTILSPLPDIPDCYFVIVKPDIMISTKEAYEASDSAGYKTRANIDRTVNAICNGSLEDIGSSLYNKFEKIVDIPEISGIKETMLSNGALGASLTGSGSAVFGIFAEKGEADDCADILEKKYKEVFVARPVNESPTGGRHSLF